MPEPESQPLSPFNRQLGIAVEDLSDGTSQLSLADGHGLHNELGFVHGAVPMALLDGAMGRTALITEAPGTLAATVQFSVQFLAPATGTLRATARVVRAGRSLVFVEGECHRDDGTLVARAHGTWSVRRPAGDAT